MEINRVFDILDNLKLTSSKNDILCSKENKKWVSYSVDNFVSTVNFISAGLLALGLKKTILQPLCLTTGQNGILLIMELNR